MRRSPPIGRAIVHRISGFAPGATHRWGCGHRSVLAVVLLSCIATAAAAQNGSTLPLPATLRIESSPQGATVFLDERLVGVTPLDIDGLNPGRRRLRIEYRGYRTYDEWISLSAGTVTEVTATLDLSTGLMEIESDHEALEMNLGSRWEPASATALPVGTYTIAFRAFGYGVGERLVTIDDDAPTVVNVRLNAAPFSVAYSGARATRFHPDNLGAKGVADLTISATGPGWYRVEIRAADGRVVATRRGTINAWSVALSWDGRDTDGNLVPDGLYTAQLAAGDGERQTRLTRAIEVTDAARMYPRLITPYGSGSSLVPFPGGRGNAVASFSVGGGYEYQETDGEDDHTVPLTIAARFAPLSLISVGAGSFIAASPEDGQVRNLSYGYLEVGPSYRVAGGVGLALYGNGGTRSIGPWRANRIGAAASVRAGSVDTGFGVVVSPGVEAALSLEEAPEAYGVAGLAAVYDSPRSLVAVSSKLTVDSDRWHILDTAFDTALRSAAGSILWTLSLGVTVGEAAVDDPTLWSLVSVGATY